MNKTNQNKQIIFICWYLFVFANYILTEDKAQDSDTTDTISYHGFVSVTLK